MTDIVARVRDLEATIAHTKALHHPSPGFNPFCVGCWEAGGMDGAPSWPCPTVRALTPEEKP